MHGISFVINTYNQVATVADCVQGALSQRLGDVPYEIIVVDDGSNDGTVEAARSVLGSRDTPPRQVVQFQHAGGVACRQHGFDLAKYELVLLLGGDFVLCDHDVVTKMMNELGDAPFVSLYGPHGGMGTLFKGSAVAAVGGFYLGFNRFGSGYRDDSDLHYRLLDQGRVGRHLPHLDAAFRHLQPRSPGWRGAVSYARTRVAVHQLDALLFRRHPARFGEDFRLLLGHIPHPVDDFKRATGLWREGGRFELSSPQGVVLVRGSSVLARLTTICGGIAYTFAVHAARVWGSLRYRTFLV